MQIVYIHGLDSNSNAEKAQKLKDFCAKNFPQIKVVAPDLNRSPNESIALIQQIIAKDPNTGLVGSSLGGFYGNILANLTGKKTVLLNPSVHSGTSLKRFFGEDFDGLPDDYIGHVTPDGWHISKKDIEWLVANRPEQSLNPQNLLVILKKGDELLNFQDAVNYFSQSTLEKSNAQSHIIVEEGGDHRMSDFETKLPQIILFLFGLPLIK